MSEKNGFKVAYPAVKDSLLRDNDFGPQYSLNPIFSKVSVPIGKLMMRGFQNTPTFEYYSKVKVLWPYKRKPNFLWDDLYIKACSAHDFRMQVEIFYLHFLSSLWPK